MAGGKRSERLNELIIDAVRAALADGTIGIGNVLRYDDNKSFSDPKDIPDLQTVQGLIGTDGNVFQQSEGTDLDADGNLDVSGLIIGLNSPVVTRIDYDYTLVNPGDNPIPDEPLTGYFNLYPQVVNGKLYISTLPPTGGSWEITVFATNSDVTPPVPVPAPTITLQPPSTATIYEGRVFSITISATNASSYQWKKNGVDISGQSTATLTISDFRTSDNASYTCYVYNGSGSTTTDACAASMFVPVAGEITIINNCGTTVDWDDAGMSSGTIADGGLNDKNPFTNGQYFGITFMMNKKLTVKVYDNSGALLSTDVYDNLYFPSGLTQVIGSMDISKGYSCLVEYI